MPDRGEVLKLDAGIIGLLSLTVGYIFGRQQAKE